MTHPLKERIAGPVPAKDATYRSPTKIMDPSEKKRGHLKMMMARGTIPACIRIS